MPDRHASWVGSLSQGERALTPSLHGDGFTLRPWHPDDLASLLHHANDPAVSRGLRDRFPYPYEEGTARCAVYKRGVLHDLRRFARVRTQLP